MINPRRRINVITLIAITFILELAGIGAAIATADADTSRGEQNYLRDFSALGLSNSGGSAEIIGDGYLICTDLRQGLAPEAIAESFWRNSIRAQGLAMGMTLDQAQGLVIAAEVDLCSSGGGVVA